MPDSFPHVVSSVFGSYRVFSECVSTAIFGELKQSNMWKRTLLTSGQIFVLGPYFKGRSRDI